MNRLIAAITGNPALLLWIALACLAFGAVSGAGGAWHIQGLRINALRVEYDGFVATTKAQGEAAKKLAERQAAADKKLKEGSDREYQTTIAALAADNQRLRDARARSGYVPAAPAGSRSPKLACFDRAELEQALQRLDAGVSGLLDEGDADAVGLNVARRWTAGIGSGKSPDNPATIAP